MGGLRGARLGMRCMTIHRSWSEKVLSFEGGSEGSRQGFINWKRRLRRVTWSRPLWSEVMAHATL